MAKDLLDGSVVEPRQQNSRDELQRFGSQRVADGALRAGQLELDGLQRRLSKAADLVDHIEPDRTLQAEALALATHLDHPVYDCLYLVLARREVATLLSADQKLLDLLDSEHCLKNTQ
ncbi:MAG: hypothetical protein RLZZ216_728 [Cyanobacteriota bacterium]